MSITQLTAHCVMHLDRLNKNFLWNAIAQGKIKSRVKWKVAAPQRALCWGGGLGIRNFTLMNRAYIIKPSGILLLIMILYGLVFIVISISLIPRFGRPQ